MVDKASGAWYRDSPGVGWFERGAMGGLHAADIAVLGLYLVGIAMIGIWSGRRIKRSADFFMPRRFGKLMMVMFSFGSGTHSDQAVGVAAKSYTSGLSGIWYQWLWLPVTPFYWLIAPVMRRFRAITTANVFEARYSRSVAMLFAVVGMLNLSVNIGIMLKGSSEVISASTGGLLSADLAIALMTVIFVIYGVAGGLAAAIVTDFIQGVLTIIFSFLLLPLILDAVGGMAGIRDAIADPGKLSLVAPEGIGIFYVAVIALNALVGIVVQPHDGQLCGRADRNGRARRIHVRQPHQAHLHDPLGPDGSGGRRLFCSGRADRRTGPGLRRRSR